MTDAAIIAIVGAISGTASAIVTGYFGYKIKKTTDTTLKHVNHAVIAQAKVYAAAARLNAELSGNPGYKKIADDAEAVLADLIKAQAQIDRGLTA
jgi:hypothetical protein